MAHNCSYSYTEAEVGGSLKSGIEPEVTQGTLTQRKGGREGKREEGKKAAELGRGGIGSLYSHRQISRNQCDAQMREPGLCVMSDLTVDITYTEEERL